MIVLELAVAGRPIPRIKLLPFIARTYPRRALIWRPGVVSTVPDITIVRRIPVTVHPRVAGSRAVRTNPKHPWRGRRPNPDPYGYLREY